MSIFRAKKINNNNYIIGFYYNTKDINKIARHYIMVKGDSCLEPVEIDATTLAIHFPDMLDSQGNKIFASLNEDGKGGDILEYEDVIGTAYLDIYTYSVRANTNQGYLMPHMFRNSKIIGIQE